MNPKANSIFAAVATVSMSFACGDHRVGVFEEGASVDAPPPWVPILPSLDCVHDIVQDPAIADKLSCSISKDIADERILEEGQQLRVVHGETGDVVVFTIATITADTSQTIGLTPAGLERFGANPPSEGCAATHVVPAALDWPDAEATGDFTSFAEHGPRSDSLIMCPHGAEIEAGTCSVARQLAELWPGGRPVVWGVEGWGSEWSDAFKKGFVPCTVIHLDSFPLLEEIVHTYTEYFERVVSIHGHQKGGGICEFEVDIVVGGGASKLLREEIRDELITHMPHAGDVRISVDGETCSGTSSDNVANRWARCGGVVLSLSWELRQDEKTVLALMKGVAEVLDEWGGCDADSNDHGYE